MSELEAGKTYKITNVKAGTALDLSGTDNSSVIGWTSHDGANQKWLLGRIGNQWTFRNVGNGRYLGLSGHPNDGTPLVAVDDFFKWDIYRDDNDGNVYRIFVPDHPTPINVDLSDHGNANPGTPITLWGKWEGKHQTWRFQEV
ncbi:carbohydrate-binding module family 13 protein [Collybia nuda]|uniref:Carbohydrate-binding module family 13 protein n=1 Tax=Collybia nuda TaxID=64659 RepID=A0A9P5YEQ6_9AGAR|nr:carbohydrate-binding module family 13 protein [Collybia nuda]